MKLHKPFIFKCAPRTLGRICACGYWHYRGSDGNVCYIPFFSQEAALSFVCRTIQIQGLVRAYEKH